MEKIYYKIYRLYFQTVCEVCKKKDIIPNEEFFIDETEYEKALNSLGTEDRLKFKNGFINMKYVGMIKYSHLEENLLADKFTQYEKPI